MSLRIVIVVSVITCFSGTVQAQTSLNPQVVVSANGGIQAHSSPRTDIVNFSLNQETGSLKATQTLGPYGVFDAGVSVRVWRQWGVGVAISGAGGQTNATLEAKVPHPFFFEFDRTATGSAEGLRYQELAFHVYGQFRIPLGTSTLLTLSVGPSFLKADQELVSGVTTDEHGVPFTQVSIVSRSIERFSTTTRGYNVGADLAYYGLRRFGVLKRFELLDHVGVGFMTRFSWAKPTIELLGVRQEHPLRVGALHAIGGVRVGF